MAKSEDCDALAAAEALVASGDRFSGADATLLAHYYRGEMTRLTAWRARMDMTTHWAVIATIGLLSFAFANPQADAIFVIAVSTLWFLLTVEARRYRFYDVWRWRLRILEAHRVAPAIARDDRYLRGPWREDLTADLLYPTFKITMREAMGRRLLRNYIYLFGLTLILALAHIFGLQPATGTWSQVTRPSILASVRDNLSLLILIGIGYVPLIALGLFGWRRRNMTVELHDHPVRRPYRV